MRTETFRAPVQVLLPFGNVNGGAGVQRLRPTMVDVRMPPRGAEFSGFRKNQSPIEAEFPAFDGEHFVPLRFCNLLQLARMSYTRVVDEDVDATKVRLNLRDHAPQVCSDRYIGLHRQCLPSVAGNLPADHGGRIGVLAVVHGDICTRPSQSQRDSTPDAATRTSNKSNPVP